MDKLTDKTAPTIQYIATMLHAFPLAAGRIDCQRPEMTGLDEDHPGRIGCIPCPNQYVTDC